MAGARRRAQGAGASPLATAQALTTALLLLLASPSRAGETCRSLVALKAERVPGTDYRETLVDRHAEITALAVHGGTIEPGTSELALRLAGDDWNLYLFEGLLPPRRARELHVSSTRIDDPGALRLVGLSRVAVSVHGEKDRGKSTCVGGRAAALAAATAKALSEAGFAAEHPCKRLPGANPANIVNRAIAGVQLELGRGLRKRLASDPEALGRYAAAVRKAVAGPPNSPIEDRHSGAPPR